MLSFLNNRNRRKIEQYSYAHRNAVAKRYQRKIAFPPPYVAEQNDESHTRVRAKPCHERAERDTTAEKRLRDNDARRAVWNQADGARNERLHEPVAVHKRDKRFLANRMDDARQHQINEENKHGDFQRV